MKARTGRNRELWPVLALLLLAVVVPTAGVLWFMGQAMRNERLAVRQKLETTYRNQLLGARSRLETYWQGKATALTDTDPSVPAAELFARLVRAGVADSVILYDSAMRLIYPSFSRGGAGSQELETQEWTAAEELEYDQADRGAAAAAYAKIAERAADGSAAARALQAQARCLVGAGKTQTAFEILIRTLADARYREATDTHGRLIQLDARLRGLQLMGGRHPDFRSTFERLIGRVTDYRDPSLSASQRRFLMHELQELAPDRPLFDTLAAEDLAAEYVEANLRSSVLGELVPALTLDGIWQWVSPDHSVTALFRQERMVFGLEALIDDHLSLPDATVKVIPPKPHPPSPDAFITLLAGTYLPDWRLALYMEGPNPLGAAADRQIAVYLWTGLLVIVVVAVLGLLTARYVGRQMKLTRLKNDLIATVSHEIKTPLASMRVLADTLLAGSYHDEQQAREYVQLIAKENARLSRLIDNFLTFSRMERNKQRFDFVDVDVEAIVTTAIEAAGEKFASADCRLDVEIAPDLPTITGDRDALVTVLLNLLDNAHKYSQDHKHIVVRAHEANGNVCLEVQDNGIGLSGRTVKKVFDRFYQVDRSLSRTAGGCGLGLSIVKFIVTAHGGAVGVTSRPGEGSTFTVRMPVSMSDER